MPIYKGNLKTIAAYKGVNPLIKIYKGTDLVFYNLPFDYQQVEYLESTGTQYIDTGYSPNNNSKMLLDYQLTVIQSKMYAGARSSAALVSTGFTINSSTSSNQIVASWGNVRNASIGSMITDRFTTQIGQDGIYFNNTKVVTPEAQTWSLTQKVVLFAVMQGTNNEIALNSEVKIYKCKIWENDNLVRNFIPCYRKSDNVAGMYDTVTGAFYTNSGTGEFVAGSDISTSESDLTGFFLGNSNSDLPESEPEVRTSMSEPELKKPEPESEEEQEPEESEEIPENSDIIRSGDSLAAEANCQ